MPEYYDTFVKLKKQMDDKCFEYDKIQPWEKDITNSINNSNIVVTINEVLSCLNLVSTPKKID